MDKLELRAPDKTSEPPAGMTCLLMAKPVLDEARWAVLDPLLSPEPRRPRGGRLRLPSPTRLDGGLQDVF